MDTNSCCGHHKAHSTGHRTTTTSVNDDELAECPVMKGNLVNKAEALAAGLVRDYAGTRYYLCCAGCAPLFDGDPAKYANAS